MAKVYYMSIDWEGWKAARTDGERAEHIRIYEASDGEAIDGFITPGWRLYAYTTKNRRDYNVHDLINLK